MKLLVAFSEITELQKREKALEEMICTTLDPFEAKKGQTGNG